MSKHVLNSRLLVNDCEVVLGLGRPYKSGFANYVVCPSNAEVTTVEGARHVQAEQERLAADKSPAAPPRRQRPARGVRGEAPCSDFAVDEHIGTASAYSVSRNGGDLLNQRDAVGQVTARCSEPACRQRREGHEHFAFLDPHGSTEAIETDRAAWACVPDKHGPGWPEDCAQ
jgi:hypothetical protein